MGASLAAQLEPLLRAWGESVEADAAAQVFALTQEECPVGDTGALKASGVLEQTGPASHRISYDDVGFTDVGPEAHRIEGSPLLAFDWPAAGLFPAIFRSVNWVPGPGVAANRGWFSERSATQEQWDLALADAAEHRDL